MPEQFVFRDLRDLLAKANEEKSGDQLAGIAARSERERVAAKRKLAGLSLGEIVRATSDRSFPRRSQPPAPGILRRGAVSANPEHDRG